VRIKLEDVESGLAELVAELDRKVQEHPRRRTYEAELRTAERAVLAALKRMERVGGAVATMPAAEAVRVA
jgi:hypothetical protein